MSLRKEMATMLVPKLVVSHFVQWEQTNHFISDTEDLPRYRPPIPTVTTSGSSDVTQHQSFSHALPRQRPPAGPGQLGGKTLTVKTVCRPDIHAQKGGAGDKPQTLL